MAGETIFAQIRDRVVPNLNLNVVWVEWNLSAPITGPDGVSYQGGTDPVVISITEDAQATQKRIRDGVADRVAAVTGQAFAASDVKGFQAIRTGTIAVTTLDTSKAVTFATPMPSTNYRIAFQSQTGIAANLGYSGKTVNGFTLNLSVGVNATVDYLAVED